VVKSQAVIKLSPVQLPAHFKRLECNTNLNLPPLNWLTTSHSSHGLHQALYQSAGFASFRLGQMFPDCVGEVDVVSDAENIKQLLKLPYSAQSAICPSALGSPLRGRTSVWPPPPSLCARRA